MPKLCLFVDDLTLHLTGTERYVATALPEILADCIDRLEGELEMKVSRGLAGAKTVGVASTRSLALLLQPRLKRRGVITKQKTKLLGIDYAAGKKTVRDVQRQRIADVAGRVGRYKRLRRRVAHRLVRTGAAPAMRYGAVVVGSTDSAIRAARRFSCAVGGEMRGRSAFARLQLAGYDVGAQMATDPISSWAKAVWDNFGGKDNLAVAWRRAMTTVALAERPFSQVTGPAGAMVASALRLGWKIPKPHILIDGAGTVLDMRKMCPLDVTAYAKEALAAIEAASSTLAAWIGGPPDLEPLCDHVKKKGVSAVAAGSLRALGEGAWWTQERMHAAGFQGVSDPYCRACGPESQVGGTQKLGTLHHRFVECAATASLRLRHKDRHILDVATSLLRESEPLFQ